MKILRVAIIILFLSVTAFAAGTKYLLFWVNETMSQANMAKVRDKIAVEFPAVTNIKIADLPRWRVVSNTNKVGRVLCVDMTRWSHKWTQAQAEAWCIENLGDDANKIRWVTDDNPQQALIDGGLERLPVEPE